MARLKIWKEAFPLALYVDKFEFVYCKLSTSQLGVVKDFVVHPAGAGGGPCAETSKLEVKPTISVVNRILSTDLKQGRMSLPGHQHDRRCRCGWWSSI